MQSINSYTNFDIIRHHVTNDVWMKLGKGWYLMEPNGKSESRMRKSPPGKAIDYYKVGNIRSMGALICVMLKAHYEWLDNKIEF